MRSNTESSQIKFDPKELLATLYLGLSRIKGDLCHYRVDPEKFKLIPCDASEDKDPWDVLGVKKTVDPFSLETIITLASFWATKYTFANSTRLEFIQRKGTLTKVHFQSSWEDNPHIHIQLEPEGDHLTSIGFLHMGIINQCSSLNLNYKGGEHILVYESTYGSSADQTPILFKGAGVPNINIDSVIYASLLEKPNRLSEKIPHPTLTFDPRRHCYHPGLGYSYLVHKQGDIPEVKSGSIISGVTLLDDSHQASSVKVQITKLNEFKHKYSDGLGIAFRVFGKVEINDGSRTSYNSGQFIVYSDRKWLGAHPEMIVGAAFEKFHSKK